MHTRCRWFCCRHKKIIEYIRSFSWLPPPPVVPPGRVFVDCLRGTPRKESLLIALVVPPGRRPCWLPSRYPLERAFVDCPRGTPRKEALLIALVVPPERSLCWLASWYPREGAFVDFPLGTPERSLCWLLPWYSREVLQIHFMKFIWTITLPWKELFRLWSPTCRSRNENTHRNYVLISENIRNDSIKYIWL